MGTNFQKIIIIKKLWYLLLPPGREIYCFVSPKQNILTDLYTSSFTSSFMELTMIEFREVLYFPREIGKFLGFVCLFVIFVCLVFFFYLAWFFYVFVNVFNEVHFT